MPLLRLVGTTCPPVLIRSIVAEKTLKDDRLMANCEARRLVLVLRRQFDILGNSGDIFGKMVLPGRPLLATSRVVP